MQHLTRTLISMAAGIGLALALPGTAAAETRFERGDHRSGSHHQATGKLAEYRARRDQDRTHRRHAAPERRAHANHNAKPDHRGHRNKHHARHDRYRSDRGLHRGHHYRKDNKHYRANRARTKRHDRIAEYRHQKLHKRGISHRHPHNRSARYERYDRYGRHDRYDSDYARDWTRGILYGIIER